VSESERERVIEAATETQLVVQSANRVIIMALLTQEPLKY
jgi:hypothetical protein